MRLSKLVLLISAASVMASGKVSALGLGEISLKSALNEPLNAEIRLLQVRDLSEEEILVGLASNADFERVGVDKSMFLSGMKFSVDLDAANGPIIKISTNSPVREPFLNFLVESQWPSGRILREYTLLMDLPVFSAQSASKVQAPVQQAPAPAPASAPVATPAPQAPVVRTRPVAPAPAPQYAGDTYGPVSSNDTLWDIALKVRPSRQYSAQQTMIAIQKLNPDAFINDNINLLRKGQVLRIPTAEQISALNFNQAVSEVAFQNDQWDTNSATKPTLTADTQAEPARATQSSGGRVTLGVASETDVASKTSSGVGAGSDSSDALQNELGTTLEELDTAKRENSELRDKIADLEAQIDTMERLVEVSSAELRALQVASEKQAQDQQQAAEAGAESELEPTPLTVPDDEPELVEEGEEEPTSDQELNLANLDDAGESEAQEAAEVSTAASEAEQSGAEVVKPEAAKPDSRTVVTTAPAKQPGLLDTIMDNIVLLAALLIALLAAGFVLVKKLFAGKEEELEDTFNPFEEDPIDTDDADEPVVADLSEQIEEFTEDDIELDIDQPEPEPLVVATEEDIKKDDTPVVPEEVIAEADIYIAYGKYDQAEEMLEKALVVDPTNNAVRLKLLEVHADSNNLERFDKTLSELHNSGDADAVSRGNNLRDSFRDAAPFVAGAGAVASIGALAANALNKSSTVLDDEDITHRDLSQEFADLDGLSQPAAPDDSFDDFDFDLDPEFDNSEKPEVADEPELQQSESDFTAELDLDDPTAAALEENTTLKFNNPLDETDVTISRKLSDVELAALSEQETEEATQTEPDVTETELGSEDPTLAFDASELDIESDEFDLGLELDDGHAETMELDVEDDIEEEQTTTSEPEAAEVDLNSLDDDFNTDDIDSLVADADLIEDDTLTELTDLAPNALAGIGAEQLDDIEPATNVSFDSENIEDLTDDLASAPEELGAEISFETEKPAESLEFDDDLDLSFNDGDFDESGLDVIDGELEAAGTKYDNLESSQDSFDDVDLELDIGDLDAELDTPDALSLTDTAVNDEAEDFTASLELPEDDLPGDPIASFTELDQSDDTITHLADNDEPELLEDSDLQALDEEMDALASDVSLDEIPKVETSEAISDTVDENLSSDDVFAEVLASTEQNLDDITTDDSGMDVGDFDDNLDFLADTDESDTKLDLARAYIDMGDGDGARDILSEVITDGNDQQKEEAKTLLEKIPG